MNQLFSRYRILLPFFIFLLGVLPGRAQERLSAMAEVSLITCEPGDALFEAFGHTAIRVYDPVFGIDEAYNYGVFDFNQPNFYLNFAKGYLLYKLGTAPFPQFLYQYQYYDRSVHEQVLNLTQGQKQRVFEYLEINSLPENQQYYYDYFFDNCATRPRDVVLAVLGDSVKFDYSYADTLHYSIRDLIDHYIGDSRKHSWGDLGIDIGLGAKIDRQATPFEYMYQPEFLALAFEEAALVQRNGTRGPLVIASRTLYQGTPPNHAEGPTFTPVLTFWLLLVLVAIGSAFDYGQKKYRMFVFDVLFFAVVGLVGMLLVFLWFFTNHGSAGNNWNLAWAWPTHFIASFFLIPRTPIRWVRTYFLACAGVLALLLLAWTFVPQDLHDALIPVVLIQIIRALGIYSRQPVPKQKQAVHRVGKGGLAVG